jgi:cytochrome c-type protein NapC
MNLKREIWKPSKKWWMFGLPAGAIAAVLIGVLGWGGFNWALESTNSQSFCISCHEMKNTVYEEYKTTIHYRNSSGVRATCADCHVPRDWGRKVLRKIYATNELWHKMLGTIDTPEKFEARRLKLAQRVWDEMKSSDSRECRNCHDFEFMDFDLQAKRANDRHSKASNSEKGETCIDCHQGIAHELPIIPIND